MDENEDSVPEWFNQQETKTRLRALTGKADTARKRLMAMCAISPDPVVREAYAEFLSYTAASALLKPAP